MQIVQLGDKILGIQHNPGADQAGSARIQNAGGHQVQLIGLSIVYHRMTGVVASLGTYYHFRTGCKNVNNLALSFIAPLGADYNISRHTQFLISLSLMDA